MQLAVPRLQKWLIFPVNAFLPWNQSFGFHIFAQVWAISFKYFFAASRGVAPSVNVTSNLHNRGYE